MSDKPASETPASSSGLNKKKIIYIALGVIVGILVIIGIAYAIQNRGGGSALRLTHGSDLSKNSSHSEHNKESSNSLHGGDVSFLKTDAGKSGLPHSAFNF